MRTVYIFIALNAIIAVGCGGSPNTSQANTPSQSEINTTPKEESNTSTNTASLITARTYPIVDTNQHQCFNTIGVEIECNASGQDGAYKGSKPSYTHNGDGTVSDNITTLMWQQTPDTNGDGVINAYDKLSQTQALVYCENLTLAHYTDWRLPDIKTLYSLIDFSGEDVSGLSSSDTSTLSPFINDEIFAFGYGDTSQGERLIDAQWATSTLYVYKVMNAQEAMFGLNLADGRIKGYPTSNKSYYVQCVRGNTQYGQNNFIDNSDQTVSDNATGLMWQQMDSPNAMDWQSAIEYCENLTLANYTNWRLPNAKELHSIVDTTRSPDTTSSPALHPLFHATPIINEMGAEDYGFYWSSTTHKNMQNGANGVYISFGRALGYMNASWLDVHGAGAQRSDPKDITQLNTNQEGYTIVDGAITHGPQGDVVRGYNSVRCVRDAQ